MKRRDFLAGAAATTLSPWAMVRRAGATPSAADEVCCLPTYATPADAMRSPRETLLYVPGIYTGTPTRRPDYLATVDVDPQSATYSQVIHRLEMPYVDDELHHFGWNACSSCHGDGTLGRKYLVLPGLRSGRIHIVDVAEPRGPRLHKVIDGREIARRTNLSAPHTVHCLADGHIMISMLGDAQGNAPGGFVLLNQEFEIVGRWERGAEGVKYHYDFWYQPRLNVMVSSEWAAPNTVAQGFRLEDVQAGKYGRQLHFWNWQERRVMQSIDLGEAGLIPLEVRFHHNPESPHGFVGAALSSAIWHWHRSGERWAAERIVQVEPVAVEGWPFPVPGLITDLVLSMDDRWLYFSNWLHGDVRQYDVSDPANPKLTGRLWLGGLLGKECALADRKLTGGPQMLQLSLDGKRLYVTNSLYSVWDNQFYPDISRQGSFLVQIDCDTDAGGMKPCESFFVDFGKEPHGPARAHEMRFPGGDCTSDIWV